MVAKIVKLLIVKSRSTVGRTEGVERGGGNIIARERECRWQLLCSREMALKVESARSRECVWGQKWRGEKAPTRLDGRTKGNGYTAAQWQLAERAVWGLRQAKLRELGVAQTRADCG